MDKLREHGHQLDIVNRTQAQLGMLVAMFLLGIAVNLIGLPSEVSGTAKTATTIFLVLHGLLGLGLIINAGLILRLSMKSNAALVKYAQFGLGIIVLTFITGIITVETKSNWWSFAMAVGFAASLPVNGLLLLRARSK
jgi:hypothetical protein